MKVLLSRKQIISQIRFTSKRIVHKNIKYELEASGDLREAENQCLLRNLKKNLLHFIIECSIYKPIRVIIYTNTLFKTYELIIYFTGAPLL